MGVAGKSKSCRLVVTSWAVRQGAQSLHITSEQKYEPMTTGKTIAENMVLETVMYHSDSLMSLKAALLGTHHNFSNPRP